MPEVSRESLAIVTGTSTGIGEAVARQLLGRGWDVIGIARRASPVSHAAHRHVAFDLGLLAAGSCVARRGRDVQRRRARLAAVRAARAGPRSRRADGDVVSFHFGLPSAALLARVRGWGSKILAAATTVDEARWFEEGGVDAIIAQGLEAGGHRGNFLRSDLTTRLGTLALVPQAADAVRVPVMNRIMRELGPIATSLPTFLSRLRQ